MSPDQLTQTDLDRTEATVLAVLQGQPVEDAACANGMEPTNLSDAASVFRQAGREALASHAAQREWWHVYLHFTDWHRADHMFSTHVLPLLHDAETAGSLDGWWYTRKHPCWRLRLRHNPRSHETTPIGQELDRLVSQGHLLRWWPGIYEPETVAFGGAASMQAAHQLFAADSRHIQQLPLHANLPLGARELSVLLCSTLMRAAGLEWYEQGDVWHRVITAEHRDRLADLPQEALHGDVEPIRALLTSDTAALLVPGGPLEPVQDWVAAFDHAGQTLLQSVQLGTLDRGLRQVLSYHVIFHWNRLGLSLTAQSRLAAAARTAILHTDTMSDAAHQTSWAR
ncbi:thiopeptide-type bacteriocin biosynthesis protein [Actinacidiphila rubida]|nr:thiopeptide-type bacteriocin biosynthesis protein [Actinacidiphila rubida]